jgi:hypothetical protein
VLAAGDVATAAAWNVLTNDVIAHQSIMSNVVEGTYSTAVTNSTVTYATSNLAATITPFSTASRIKVEYHVQGYKPSGVTATGMNLIVYVGASQIVPSTRQQMGNVGASTNVVFTVDNAFIHSPATTSATTYTLYFASTVAGQTVELHSYGVNSPGHIILTEIPA